MAWFPRLGIRKAGEIHINKSRNSILNNSNALPICPSTDEWMKKLWSMYTMNITKTKSTCLLPKVFLGKETKNYSTYSMY